MNDRLRGREFFGIRLDEFEVDIYRHVVDFVSLHRLNVSNVSVSLDEFETRYENYGSYYRNITARLLISIFRTPEISHPIYNSYVSDAPEYYQCPAPIRFAVERSLVITPDLLYHHHADAVFYTITEVLRRDVDQHLFHIFGIDEATWTAAITRYGYDEHQPASTISNFPSTIGLDIDIDTSALQRALSRVNLQSESRPNYDDASEKAEELLYSCLSTDQRRCYSRYGYFFVIGNITGNRYKLVQKKQINVYRVDSKGNEISRHCVVSETTVPMGDHLLAQKLLIETNEDEFLRVKIDHGNSGSNYASAHIGIITGLTETIREMYGGYS